MSHLTALPALLISFLKKIVVRDEVFNDSVSPVGVNVVLVKAHQGKLVTNGLQTHYY